MRYLNNIWRVATLVAMVVLLAGCTNDTEIEMEVGSVWEGESCQASLRLSVASQSELGESRAVESQDEITSAEIKNLWVIQTSNSKVSYFPQYIENFSQESIIDVSMATDGSTKSTFYLIANTFDPDFGDKISINTTVDTIKSYVMSISEENDCFGYDSETDTYHYILSGMTESGVVEDGFAIVADLSVNLAKINFSITNTTGLYLRSIQLVDVPTSAKYFADNDSNTTYSTISYDAISIESRDDYSVTWHMPVNRRGVVETFDGASAKNKPQYAPDNSTYVRVELVQSYDYQEAIYSYLFYLGENMVNDFNISANYSYNYNITLSSSSLTQYDYRVESATVITDLTDSVDNETGVALSSAEVANCYILNPEQSSTQAALVDGVEMQKVFYIPVVERINEFWGEESVSHSDDLEFAILWSDLPSESNLDIELTKSTPSAQGEYAALMVTMPESFNHGNVVVGVKGSDGSILWSWHLWITDYDPAGEVMEYGIGYTENSSALYYQYGRKDPFTSKSSVTAERSSVANAIQNPTIFYALEGTPDADNAPKGLYNWISDEDSDYTSESITWCDKSVTDGSKSIFDPSPLGWRVPGSATLSDSGITSLDMGYIGTSGYGDDFGAIWSCEATLYEYQYSYSTEEVVLSDDVDGEVDGDGNADDNISYATVVTTVDVTDTTSYAKALKYWYEDESYTINVDNISPRYMGYPIRPVKGE